MSNLENKIFINKKGNYSTNDIPQVLFNDESANNNVSSTSKNNLTKNNSNSLKEGLDNVTDNKTINSKEEVKNLNTILPLCKIKKDFQIFKYLEIFDTIKYFELKLDIIFQDHSYSLTKYLYMCYESGYDQFEDTIFNNTEKNVLKSFTNFTDIINKIKTDIIYIIEEAKTELLQHILN
ncbi:hypothetical protein NAPIS_ORF01217 [Vairimorpha apis BRL 01]|uniref:Uncharacterized protein n=1 Tax=Vairimorpha apis BRL 01 TaxID=1037528 RepID=T0MDA8_9MICR|nr:hypothetical protein NAPIS_ORF01217 [Vairimorpha apis BRL 01]